MRITGTGGTVASGPRDVADITSWALERSGDGPSFTATLSVRPVDPYRWACGDRLSVSLSVGPRVWTWPLVGLPAQSTSITVPLDGAPLVT